MSVQYLYRCQDCDNRVLTDEQGCECTMSGTAYLYHCHECGMLAQLWQNVSLMLESKNKALVNAKWSRLHRGMRYFNGVCPICGSREIHKWNPIDNLCPKCGGKMCLDESFGFVYTD